MMDRRRRIVGGHDCLDVAYAATDVEADADAGVDADAQTFVEAEEVVNDWTGGENVGVDVDGSLAAVDAVEHVADRSVD